MKNKISVEIEIEELLEITILLRVRASQPETPSPEETDSKGVVIPWEVVSRDRQNVQAPS